MMRSYSFRGVRVFYDDMIRGADLFITGFRGFGAVGYITTLHIVEKLGCRRAGFIAPKYMPEEVTSDRNGGVVAAFTLYACESEGKRLVVLVNHDIPVVHDRARFAEAIVRWLSSEANVAEAVLVGGFDSRFRSGDENLRWVATSAFRRRLEEPMMEQGLYVIGPLALLLFFSEVYSHPAVAILPYAEASRPDPRAAAVAVQKIGQLYSLSIGVEDLLEEAKKIEEMIKVMEKQQREAAGTPSERVYM